MAGISHDGLLFVQIIFGQKVGHHIMINNNNNDDDSKTRFRNRYDHDHHHDHDRDHDHGDDRDHDRDHHDDHHRDNDHGDHYHHDYRDRDDHHRHHHRRRRYQHYIIPKLAPSPSPYRSNRQVEKRARLLKAGLYYSNKPKIGLILEQLNISRYEIKQ